MEIDNQKDESVSAEAGKAIKTTDWEIYRENVLRQIRRDHEAFRLSRTRSAVKALSHVVD